MVIRIIRRSVFIWVLFVALLGTSAVPAAEFSFGPSPKTPARLPPPAQQIQNKESLSFQVRWLGIPIGRGRVIIEEEARAGFGTVRRIRAEAKANEFFSAFYPVDDRLESVVTARNYTALSSEKNIREGRYRAHERVDFEADERRALYQSFTNGSNKVLPIPGPVHDILGAFYWFRLQNVQVGDTVKTIVNTDEKNWEMTVKILRAEQVEIRGLGTFQAFVAEPAARFKGVLVKRGRAWVYFTADSRRVPIKIKLQTPYGPVVGILESLP